MKSSLALAEREDVVEYVSLLSACSEVPVPFALCNAAGEPLVTSRSLRTRLHVDEAAPLSESVRQSFAEAVATGCSSFSQRSGNFSERLAFVATRAESAHGLWIVSLAEAARCDYRDPLTDLPSRIALRDELALCLDDEEERSRSALLLLDLDRFKSVNDTLGHQVGDRLLKSVVDRLSPCLSPHDLLVRLGGDEFAILIRATDNPQPAALRLAGRLVDLIGRSYLIEEHLITVGVSIGLAFPAPEVREPDRLLAQADLALYSAKESGRGCFRIFEPHLEQRANDRRLIEQDLRRALALRQFEVFYQAQAAVSDRRVLGFEALVRWRHPERGMISPALFIPIAEESSLIVQIGEWVLLTACKEAASWPPGVSVAVNLSPIQVLHSGLVPAVVRALEKSGLPPHCLELEITEGVLLQDSALTLKTLRQLKELGVRIAMDDFGTGYSSLSYLRSFPFDKVKIDQSFVQGMSIDPDAAAIVRAVLGLGASLGISITAEGVETEEQLSGLRAEGCNELQGFLISRPIPAAEIPPLLLKHGPIKEESICSSGSSTLVAAASKDRKRA